MQNIEGNYEEILSWLDSHSKPECYSSSHGTTGYPNRLNWGLFSLEDDYRINADSTWHKAETDMSFDPVRIKEALQAWDLMLSSFTEYDREEFELNRRYRNE